jgi:hypothetical protein
MHTSARASLSVGTFFLVALLAASGARAQEGQRSDATAAQAPSPGLPMMEPDRARLGGTCTASAPRELGRSTVRNLRLEVASQPGARPVTLAVWSGGEHAIASRRIDAELGPLQSVALDQGLNVEVLAPVSGGRFLALSVGALCSGTGARGYSCLRAIGLGSDGAPSGAAYAPEPSTQQLDVVTSTVLRGADGSPSGVAVALVSRWGGADISIFRLDSGGLVTVEEHPIRTQGPSEYPIDLLAADGEQVVALGAQEGQALDEEGVPLERRFIVALGQRRQTIAPAVPESARLRWARARGIDLDLFYALPRARVRWLRVSGTDGHFLDGTPTTFEPTAALPADPVFPSLTVTRGALSLVRTDLRVASVGPATSIARVSGRPVSSWSWDGAALHVVWGVRAGREWVISESRVSCAATP